MKLLQSSILPAMKLRQKQTLELVVVDHVARAAHLWIRHLIMSEQLTAVTESRPIREALVGGLISEVCELLQLKPQERKLTAYVYALLDQEAGMALKTSRRILKKDREPLLESAFQMGQNEGRKLVGKLQQGENGTDVKKASGM